MDRRTKLSANTPSCLLLCLASFALIADGYKDKEKTTIDTTQENKKQDSNCIITLRLSNTSHGDDHRSDNMVGYGCASSHLKYSLNYIISNKYSF